MTVVSGDCEAAVTVLRADPRLAGLLGAEAACLLWDREGARLLWASPAAAGLAAALTDADGRLAPGSLLGRVLARLAAAPASHDGTRLERLRLDINALRPPTTFACRRVSWRDGEGILTCVVGPVPALRPASPRAHPEPPAAAAPAAPPRPRVAGDTAEPAQRFVWQTDAEGRFTTLSASFVTLLAAAETDIVGRSWADLAGTVAADPDGAVAAGFASRQAWSHARSLWQLPDRQVLPVTMAASPAAGSGFEGFRGFGRYRLSEVEPGDIAPPAAAAPGSEPGLDAAALAVTPAPGEPAAGGAMAPVEAPAETVPAFAERAGAESPPAPEGGAAPAAAASRPAAQEQAGPVPVGAPYKTTHPLHPMFQALLDASLSGLSHFIAALPPAADGEKPKAANAEPSAAADIQAGPEAGSASEPQDGQAPAEPEARSEAEQPARPEAGGGDALPPGSGSPESEKPSGMEPEPEQPAPASPKAFGGLHTQVAAEFGPPPSPLRLAYSQADTAPGEENRSELSPSAAEPVAEPPVLSFSERGAFHEIARVLGARLEPEPQAGAEPPRESADVIPMPQPRFDADARRLLDDLPAGLMVLRDAVPVLANRRLLDLAGYADLGALAAAGGLAALFPAGADALLPGPEESRGSMLTTRVGGNIPVELLRRSAEWRDAPALLVLVLPRAAEDAPSQVQGLACELETGRRQLEEARAALELAADGIVMLDQAGRILSLNGSGETLFGYAQGEIAGEDLGILLAPTSHAAALAALAAARQGEARQEPVALTGRTRRGEPVALSVAFGRVGPGADAPLCAILRNDARLRQAETELARAKRVSGKADRQAADFLARISHEVRTPLNAIIGFAEVMIEERFGPIGTERYKAYLADIRESGTEVIKLVDDLVDLANAITGRFEIPEEGVDLNQAVVETVAALQPAAARARIVVRTSFAAALPRVFVDARSLRQVVDNILSNAIRFTEAGGQVIASTAVSDRGEIALHIRDTGIGMSAEDIELALEPFRQASVLRTEGRGLGLPLAKALIEANRGSLTIASRPGEGTLVEILFPAAGPRAVSSAADDAGRRRNA